MATVEKTIEVDVPVSTAYNQWTQFEEFPRFMEGVREVRQLDDKRLHWRADIAGKEKEWDAEIVEQTPDQRVAWRSTSGAENSGTVNFQSLGANRTRVTLRLDYDPEGIIENIGDALGAVSRRVEGDLERFKEFIESRGSETGAWRGEIHGGHVASGTTSGAQGMAGSAAGAAGTPDLVQRGGPSAPSDVGSGLGSGAESALGGGLGSVSGPNADLQSPNRDVTTGTSADRSASAGTTGSNVGGSATGTMGSSSGSTGTSGVRSEAGLGTGSAGGTSDAGGGSGATGGITSGVGGTALSGNEGLAEDINQQRRESPGGKVSQRDDNLKVD